MDFTTIKNILESHIIEDETKAILTEISNSKKEMTKAELNAFLKGKEGSILVLVKGVKEGFVATGTKNTQQYSVSRVILNYISVGMVGHRSIEFEEVAGIAGWINFKLKARAQ